MVNGVHHASSRAQIESLALWDTELCGTENFFKGCYPGVPPVFLGVLWSH